MESPRYSVIPLPEAPTVDASVPCLVLCWPVVDPLARYFHAQQLKRDGNKFGEHLFEGMSEAFITTDPAAPQSIAAVEKIVEFVHRELG